MDKTELRREIREKKRAMTPEEIERRSRELGRKFAATEAYRRAKTIYGYMPYNQEVMPGLAFDPQGHRIGYGGGFYDKFLSREPNHPTLALCYDFQMLPHLDTEEHDIPVDTVLWA